MESVVTERLYVSKKDHTFSGGGATGCQGEEPHVVHTGCQEEWPYRLPGGTILLMLVEE